MRYFHHPKRVTDDTELDRRVVDEAKLQTAERRANTLVAKASELATIVTRRDQANHWQESVNQLFSGGKP